MIDRHNVYIVIPALNEALRIRGVVEGALRACPNVIVIDDGLATGASMRAAVAGLRARHPARIVIAVPAAAAETCDMFRSEVDEVVCAITPEPFHGVSRWYEDFSQVTDEEVRTLLEEANRQLLYGGAVL